MVQENKCIDMEDRKCTTVYEEQCKSGTEKKCSTVVDTVSKMSNLILGRITGRKMIESWRQYQ